MKISKYWRPVLPGTLKDRCRKVGPLFGATRDHPNDLVRLAVERLLADIGQTGGEQERWAESPDEIVIRAVAHSPLDRWLERLLGRRRSGAVAPPVYPDAGTFYDPAFTGVPVHREVQTITPGTVLYYLRIVDAETTNDPADCWMNQPEALAAEGERRRDGKREI